MSEDDEYVWVKRETVVKVKIPEGHVKCPMCKGSGEIRRYYGQPWDRSQFMTCWICHGEGFVAKEFANELKKVAKNEEEDSV